MFRISYTNGTPSKEVDTYTEAVKALRRTYPRAVFARSDGWEGEPTEDLSVIVWRDKRESRDDDGARAIAEIERTA